ncbi:T9SS type A sorting domain-containing protein [Ochrovirga pacifica]|uniref:T9SS type A sorting domain-containing protein n=1 Tax=Ochrovirga pacifica TaxID=1042376 RepID=UPI0002D74176|nr:T9SS type A sorting domain-containing protein [Ochrovirga pacifica]
MMSFMERPDAIAIAIPFTIVKAEWGFNHDKNLPYGSRLMRKSNEPDSYTGEWVYTERVKFYQLWKNVKGKRVDSFASDLDVQVDAYVDGKNAYVILNNLEFQDKTIQLNLLDVYGNQLSKVLQKHLTIAGTNPVLIEKELPLPVSQITLGPGATMILECAFNNEVIIDETSKETKFYADRYLQPIVANQTNEFQIHHVTKTSEFGEGVLRISIGRDHGAELIPTVIMNGVALKVPEDYRGYNQADKKRFFGTLEIPVPYHLIQESNNITVQYPDNGGHISSVILQAFDFSANIRAIDLANLPLNNYQIKTTTPSCSDESDGVIEINTQVAVPYQAIFKENGEERVKVFNSQLRIENLAAGEYELVLAPKDLLTHQSVFKIRIHEAKGLSIKSTVNQLQNKMQLSLEGAERYWIKLNGKEHAYTSNKIELNLLRGLNTLEVRSDKPCQGTYKKEVYAGQEYVISRTSNNRLNVRLNPNRVPSTLTFFNVMGQQIKQTLMTGSEISLQTSDLTSGIYFLIFQQQNQVYAKTKWFVP